MGELVEESRERRSAVLIVERSAGEPPVGRHIRIDVEPGRPVFVGRDESAHVRLVDAAVSRRALRIDRVEGELRLTDLSEAGARVDGGPRWPCGRILRSGEVIELGPFALRVELDPPSPQRSG